MSEPNFQASLELTAIEAWADRVEQIAFTLPDGCTLLDAVQWLAQNGFAPIQSRLDEQQMAWQGSPQNSPNLDLLINQQIGLFGVRCRPNDRLKTGDRIEFYRSLTIDPKLARSSAVEVARRKLRQTRDARRLAAKT